MLHAKSVLILSVLALVPLLSLNSFAAPEGLSPKALACYEQAVENDEILMKNKIHGMMSDDQIEKLAVSSCTYSDAPGFLRCYNQAAAMDEVMPRSKDLVNIFGLEKKYARLCSNSGRDLVNKTTGDADAVECFKQVMADPQVLVAAKEYMEAVEREDLVIKMCISSNGLGATSCYKKSIEKAEKILKTTRQYTGPAALDHALVDLCKGSRLR
jgi:hypothetical protein